MPQVEAMQKALAQAARRRSWLLPLGHALDPALGPAQAANGANPFEIAAKAASGGYDISPIRAQVDILSARAN
jgi:hypothetical protein